MYRPRIQIKRRRTTEAVVRNPVQHRALSPITTATRHRDRLLRHRLHGLDAIHSTRNHRCRQTLRKPRLPPTRRVRTSNRRCRRRHQILRTRANTRVPRRRHRQRHQGTSHRYLDAVVPRSPRVRPPSSSHNRRTGALAAHQLPLSRMEASLS